MPGSTANGTPCMIRRMGFVYWISEATDTHSEYIILTALRMQQWFGKSASLLRLYLHCLRS